MWKLPHKHLSLTASLKGHQLLDYLKPPLWKHRRVLHIQPRPGQTCGCRLTFLASRWLQAWAKGREMSLLLSARLAPGFPSITAALSHSPNLLLHASTMARGRALTSWGHRSVSAKPTSKLTGSNLHCRFLNLLFPQSQRKFLKNKKPSHRTVWAGRNIKAPPVPTPCHGLAAPTTSEPGTLSNPALSRAGAPTALCAAVPAPQREESLPNT